MLSVLYCIGSVYNAYCAYSRIFPCTTYHYHMQTSMSPVWTRIYLHTQLDTINFHSLLYSPSASRVESHSCTNSFSATQAEHVSEGEQHVYTKVDVTELRQQLDLQNSSVLEWQDKYTHLGTCRRWCASMYTHFEPQQYMWTCMHACVSKVNGTHYGELHISSGTCAHITHFSIIL